MPEPLANPAAAPLPSGGTLSARKRAVLRIVLDQYIREVHPVSSQAVAAGLNVSSATSLSSATIRHELAALEEQGYLRQPHTSGGRVPTDRAYRFLVEELVAALSDTIAQRSRVSQVYRQLGTETEALLEGTLDILTEMTGYVAWVSLPVPSTLDIKSINFVEVDTRELLLVLVTGAGVMQSRLVTVDTPVKDLNPGLLAERLNGYLRGRSVLEVDHEEIQRIFAGTVEAPEHLIGALRDFFASLSARGERVLFSNALQLVLQPEFARADRLAGVMHALEDREAFAASLRRQFADAGGVQTIIGSENDNPLLRECSLVLSRYSLPGDAGEGSVGVLGPTRLFYARTLPWVQAIGEAVAQALSELGAGRPGAPLPPEEAH
jgi:heat-inducible transcriptional repressor